MTKQPLAAFNKPLHGIRAIAVALVLFYHAGLPGLSGGYVGVDVFFVISGYLITVLLLNEFARTGSIDLVAFYGRRARRLLPAACLVIVVTTTLFWLVLSPLEFDEFSPSAVASTLYASNLWFAYITTDYLAGTTDTNPLLHTWSLAIEEQFYIFWPVLVLLLFRYFPSPRESRKILATIAAMVVLSMLLCIVLTLVRQPWAFFHLPARAWEFGAGALIALYAGGSSHVISPSLRTGLSIAGVSLLGLAGTLFDHSTNFPGVAALVPVIGTALLIFSCCSGAASENRSIITSLLSSPPVQFVGDISYSLYLWHWPVFLLIPLVYPTSEIVQGTAGVALSVILAWLSYRWVENPIRFSLRLSNSGPLSLKFGVALSLLALVVSVSEQKITAHFLASPEQELYHLARQDIPRIYAENCHLGFFDVTSPDCNYGVRNANKTMVLFGDSHAAQWFPALEKIAVTKGYRLVNLTKSSCPSFVMEFYNSALGRNYHECSTWREHAFATIAALRPDMVILSNSNGYVDMDTASARSEWVSGAKESISRLVSSSRNVTIIRDTPRTDFDPPTCLSRSAWRHTSTMNCTFNNAAPADEVINDELKRITEHLKNTHLVDMTPHICSQSTCEVERDGVVLYRDSHHITTAFSKLLSGPLTEALSI